jgi:hypothetical protein
MVILKGRKRFVVNRVNHQRAYSVKSRELVLLCEDIVAIEDKLQTV